MIEIIQNVGIRLKFSYIHVPGFADVGSVQHEHDYVPQTLKRFLILPSPQVLRVVCGHHTWVLRPLFWVTEWDWVRFSAMSCKIHKISATQLPSCCFFDPRSADDPENVATMKSPTWNPTENRRQSMFFL